MQHIKAHRRGVEMIAFALCDFLTTSCCLSFMLSDREALPVSLPHSNDTSSPKHTWFPETSLRLAEAKTSVYAGSPG